MSNIAKLSAGLIIIALAITVVLLAFKANANKPWKSAQSNHFTFSISYPPDWRQSEEENLFYLVNTKSKADNFRTYITITNINPLGQNTPAGETFEKIYSSSENSNVSEFFAKPQLTQSSETKVKNIEVDSTIAVEVNQETAMPGPIYSTNIYVSKDNQVWTIRLIASSIEDLAKNREVFNAIVSTFKFTN